MSFAYFNSDAKRRERGIQAKREIIRAAREAADKPVCCWIVTEDGHMRECGAKAVARNNKNTRLFYCEQHTDPKRSHRLGTGGQS